MITYLFPFLVMVKVRYDPQSKTDVASKFFISIVLQTLSGKGQDTINSETELAYGFFDTIRLLYSLCYRLAID